MVSLTSNSAQAGPPRAAEEHADKALWLPSPAEIAGACAEIRAGWSAAERRRATTYKPLPWEVPLGIVAEPLRRRVSPCASVAVD